jgi:hypothetical protein
LIFRFETYITSEVVSTCLVQICIN